MRSAPDTVDRRLLIRSVYHALRAGRPTLWTLVPILAAKPYFHVRDPRYIGSRVRIMPEAEDIVEAAFYSKLSGAWSMPVRFTGPTWVQDVYGWARAEYAKIKPDFPKAEDADGEIDEYEGLVEPPVAEPV